MNKSISMLILFVIFFILHSGSGTVRKYGFKRLAQCPALRIANGAARMKSRGRLVRFLCHPPYELVGNRYSSCRNGAWDEPPAVCVMPGCEMPELKNGLIIPSKSEAWLLFFCLPNYKLVGSDAAYCNGTSWNTTIPTCVDSLQPPELSCDFEEEGLCGWIQDETHNFDWKRHNKNTPSSFLYTGPSYDHTLGKEGKTGYYMYIESTSKLENDSARLLSPIYDKQLTIDGCFSFYYHMYGATVGTLKVYQKPDSLSLQTLLSLSDDDKKSYILFEKSKNQGDHWSRSVNYLRNFDDDFQIVIEGICGRSFTSDIAIDDVAILRGDNCTEVTSTTPQYYPPGDDSCAGRCMMQDANQNAAGPGCGCTLDCVLNQNCCVDFFDLCVFNSDSTLSDDNLNETSTETNEMVPQSAKLVGSPGDVATVTATIAPEPTTKAVNTKTATTKAAIVKLKTTQKSTTKTATTKAAIVKLKTTQKSTTKLVTSKTASTKLATPKAATAKEAKITKSTKIPKLVFKTTTKMYNATGIIAKDTLKPPVNKNVAKTTIKSVATKTTPTVATLKTTLRSTKSASTNPTATISTLRTTTEVKEDIKALPGLVLRHPSSQSSSHTGLIVLAVLTMSAAVACLALASRTWRGRVLLARLRGRTLHDQEVQYLTRDQD